MAYYNPYRLFDLPVFDRIPADILRQARKRVLAEFELTDEIQANFKGILLDKSTALRLFDELEDEKKRNFHQYVMSIPGYARFLETEGREGGLPEDFGPLNNLSFYAFIEPELKRSLKMGSSRFLREDKFQELATVLKQFSNHHPELVESIAEGAKPWFDHQELYLADLKDPTFDKGDLPTTLLALLSPEKINFLNALPTFHQKLLDNYVMQLLSLCAVWHDNSWIGPYQIGELLENALKLNISYETRHLVETRIKLVYPFFRMLKSMESISAGMNDLMGKMQASEPAPTSSSRAKAWGTFFGLILLLVFAVLMLRLSGGGKSSRYRHIDIPKINIPDYSFDPKSIKIPDYNKRPVFNADSFRRTMDSLLKSMDLNNKYQLKVPPESDK